MSVSGCDARGPAQVRLRAPMERLPTRLHGPILLAAAGPRRRARLLHRELPRRRTGPPSAAIAALRAGQPLAIGRGVLRGMHFHARRRPGEARPLRAGHDLGRGRRRAPRIADLRRVGGRSSSTTSRMHQLYVPLGFAHGFCVLSEIADVTYKLSSYYDPAHERGFAYDDPDVGIPVAVGHRAAGVRARPHRAAAVGAAARPAVLTGRSGAATRAAQLGGARARRMGGTRRSRSAGRRGGAARRAAGTQARGPVQGRHDRSDRLHDASSSARKPPACSLGR